MTTLIVQSADVSHGSPCGGLGGRPGERRVGRRASSQSATGRNQRTAPNSRCIGPLPVGGGAAGALQRTTSRGRRRWHDPPSPLTSLYLDYLSVHSTTGYSSTLGAASAASHTRLVRVRASGQAQGRGLGSSIRARVRLRVRVVKVTASGPSPRGARAAPGHSAPQATRLGSLG